MSSKDDKTLSLNSIQQAFLSIGPYRLIQMLGIGGMGELWRAEQTEPFHRTVALKLIKAGMDTRSVVARFEAERQALALMEHPNIAKVFDAGATPEGRPYFVMEYVPGLPITTYCDRHRLTIKERLILFSEVCEGGQHAHQKAIIHRDLKPSNVLVGELDQKPVPKIIDFGLTKATGPRLSQATMYTELGGVVGTPDYMSPEQPDCNERNIDTRIDVYSLGVILYELLVGVLPCSSQDLAADGMQPVLKKLRADEPTLPSSKLKSLGQSSKESAAKRKEEPQTLRRRMRGELDWITVKALEKDRNRRYGSPFELAADIHRYLQNEPVLAGPPSTTYRAGKFIQRHHFGVGVAAATAILLQVVVEIPLMAFEDEPSHFHRIFDAALDGPANETRHLSAAMILRILRRVAHPHPRHELVEQTSHAVPRDRLRRRFSGPRHHRTACACRPPLDFAAASTTT
jgi:non-specific serine/threonine protein kinase/serine/threonine-protein kinase